MDILKLEKKHVDQVTEIAYQMYQMEHNYLKAVPSLSKENMHQCIEDAVDNLQGYVYLEEGELLGYLLSAQYTAESGEIWCKSPLWGYGAIGSRRENILSRLFEKMAEEISTNSKIHFDIKVYAHDESIIRLFSFLQFGIQCEEGICPTHKAIRRNNDIHICELTKPEVEQYWTEVWSMLSGIIEHLQKSPVFYPGKEFTEEVYKDFFLDKDTQVYVARKNEHMIGLIETNGEKNRFMRDADKSRNVGEAYVYDEYRGQGVAQTLLNCVCTSLKNQGINYLWVEHGTANPNARGFWNKYFNSYCYSMIREIEQQTEV